MPPIISKLVDAQEPGAMLAPDLVVANESPVGDSKLARYYFQLKISAKPIQ